MLKYVDEAKKLYSHEKIDVEGFVSLVWEGIKKSANNEHVVEKATTAFLELWVNSNGSPVSGSSIIKTAGFVSYHNPNSHGLWPWLKKNGNAGVINQGENVGGKTVYSINDTFYPALLKVVIGRAPPARSWSKPKLKGSQLPQYTPPKKIR